MKLVLLSCGGRRFDDQSRWRCWTGSNPSKSICIPQVTFTILFTHERSTSLSALIRILFTSSSFSASTFPRISLSQAATLAHLTLLGQTARSTTPRQWVFVSTSPPSTVCTRTRNLQSSTRTRVSAVWENHKKTNRRSRRRKVGTRILSLSLVISHTVQAVNSTPSQWVTLNCSGSTTRKSFFSSRLVIIHST